MQSSNILFADDTVIVHISADKDGGGRIIKTNQGLSKVFGYTRTEVMGHLINILMPSLYAKRHGDFLQAYFRTGCEVVFDNKTIIYALHRNGFCFCIVIVVKQMPSLVEGLQYVGMMRQEHVDYEYILTDTRGVIDSVSAGISSALNLSPELFKESPINIQILAPDLVKVYNPNDKPTVLLSKFQQPGGQLIPFIVPKDFSLHIQADNRKNIKELRKISKTRANSTLKGRKKSNTPFYWSINNELNSKSGINKKRNIQQQLLQSYEYRDYELLQNLRCEVNDLVHGKNHKDIEPLKLKVLKISGIYSKKGRRFGSEMEGSCDIWAPSLNSIPDDR